MIITHRLENIGAKLSPFLNVIEPLHLVFRQPSETWRHIFANGGTAEGYYPPMAYRRHEWCYSKQNLVLESHPNGRSSNLHLPFLISLMTTTEDSEGIFCGMEWSAGWYIRFERLSGSKSSLATGIKIKNLRLEPGESLNLPEVHLGFFKGGPTAGTNALRRYLYEKVCARYHDKFVIPRVSYAHWYGIDNSLNFNLMKVEAQRAAEMGVEVFTVDASWYPGDFPNGVGNWGKADPQKFPDGLKPLANYVQKLGMDFGLWFEPERAVEGTTFVRQHPEWFVPIPSGHKKQNYHLNLAIREAQDYLIEMLGEWIKRLNLHWSRWDYNIEPKEFWEAVDPTGKIQFRYLEGLYRVLDILMKRYPEWMIEGCSSGGRRIDIGTMKRAHTFWLSDQSVNSFACRYMQARANCFLPGHLLNSSVAVNLGQGDSDFNDTSVLSRMLGKLSFDGDIASWSPELTQRMSFWVAEFKAIRYLLVQNFYQLLPIPTTIEDWDAVEFVSYSGNEAVLFVFARENGGRKVIRLQGLRHNREYFVKHQPDGHLCPFSGSEMLIKGFSVKLGPNEGVLWRITLIQ